MTEKERNSKLNGMKIASIVCLVVVIVMNMFSWVSMGIDPYGGMYVKQQFEYMTDQMLDEDAMDMAQDQLDDADIDLDIDDFVADMEAFFNPIMDLGIAPLDFVSMTIGWNGMIEFMSNPELGAFMGYSVLGDLEDMAIMNMMSTILTIGAALPIITIALAILHIVFHLINRKGLGISVPIFTFITMLYMAVVWLIATAAASGWGSYAIITLAPFVALVCGILSCVFWGRARKYINMVQIQPAPLVAPQALVQPTPQVQAVAPVAPQAPVQPAPQAQPATKFCTSCGNQLVEGTKFCPKCGSAQ